MDGTRYETVGAGLVKRYGTRDPFCLAQHLGIHVYEEDFRHLKGMYRVILRRRCIFINRNLDEDTARIVCAHEIGHDRLHRDFAGGDGLLEFALYDMSSRREYEANMVAAAILLPDEELLEHIYQDHYDAEQIARVMHSDINLVALKIAGLRAKGHPLHTLGHDSRFLK